MHLPIHTTDTAPEGSRELLGGIRDDIGLVPNLAAAAATSPGLLAGFDGLRRAVGSTGLDPVLREIAGLTTGVEVDNRYGIAFHSTVLAGLGVDEGDIEAVRSGRAPSAPAAAAVHAFVLEAVRQRGRVGDDRIDALRAAGLSDEAVLEVLLEVAFASLVGLIDNVAGHVELDEFLRPRAAA
jgi:alkylhydroperoxidase family enzyme